MMKKRLTDSVCRALLAVAAMASAAHAQTAPPSDPPRPAEPAAAPASPAPPDAAKPTEPPAEKSFKNIQVLTGLPASQLLPVMHLMRSSLGVRCDFCHTGVNNEYDLDTKRAKKTAREMIRMVLEINKNNFRGQTDVTCNTCHRGQARPVAVPPIEQGQFEDTTRGTETRRDAFPPAAQVIDHYLEALGGRAALEGLKTRVSRGTLLHSKVVNSGTPEARAVNRGQEDPVELVQEAPLRFRLTIGPAAAQTVEAFDGSVGAIRTPTEERPLPPAQIKRDSARMDLQKDLRLRDRVDRMRVVGKEQIGGRDAYVVRGNGEDGRRESLFFDVQTGLLLRRIAYTPTLLGADPEQTEFEDYRDVAGVKVPFAIKVSYLDDNHLGTTLRLTEVRNNVSVEPTSFQPPR